MPAALDRQYMLMENMLEINIGELNPRKMLIQMNQIRI